MYDKGFKVVVLFENPIRSSLDLASFSWNPSILTCLERSSTPSWSLLTLPFVTISEQDVSSTYFHMSAGVSKSLIITILFPGGRKMVKSAIQSDNLGQV